MRSSSIRSLGSAGGARRSLAVKGDRRRSLGLGTAPGSAPLALLALATLFFPVPRASAQVVADVALEGTVFVGDTLMRDGTVVLHRLSEGSEGELDSLAVAEGGTFSFPLPNVPDPERSDVFFASVRHHGVLYFGPAITSAAQLDSIYEIHAYDTLMAPAEGLSVPIQSRSVFFEPDSAGWRVTDLFQLRNDASRTVVAREGGRVWGHALPDGASNVTAGEGELAFDAARYEDGELVVRAALPPGERLFVVRYEVDSPEITIPLEGAVEALDLLVREPAPPLSVEGLELLDRIELEPGSTYIRYSGADVTAPEVRITRIEESTPPRVEWVAVLLALVLTGAALHILRPRRRAEPGRPPVPREALVRQVAILDEEHDPDTASEEARLAYERRRAALIRRIRALDA